MLDVYYNLKNSKDRVASIVILKEKLKSIRINRQEIPDLSETLATQIEENTKALEQQRSFLKSDIKYKILKLSAAKNRLKAVKNSATFEKAAEIDQHLKKIDQLLPAMVYPFFEKDLDEFAKQDEEAYWTLKGLYFEQFPERATAHYIALLADTKVHQNTLELLNHILITHPEKDSPVTQAIHCILAHHFLTIDIDQACHHALKLDSNDEGNADLKSIIIKAAFYPNSTNLKLPDGIEATLLTSHIAPEASYQQIRSLVPAEKGQAMPPAIQFPTEVSAPSSTTSEADPEKPDTNSKKTM